MEIRLSVKAKWANVSYAKVVTGTNITLAYCTTVLLGFKPAIFRSSHLPILLNLQYPQPFTLPNSLSIIFLSKIIKS